MSKLVPYSILKQLSPEKGAFNHGQEIDNLAGEKFSIQPSPGCKSRLVGIRSLTPLDRAIIVEVRIGDEYIWPQGVIDVGQFNTSMPYIELKIGEITEERPLEFFTQVVGWPASPPTLNMAFFGEESPLDENAIKEDNAFRARNSGMLRLADVNTWLGSHPEKPNYRDFFDGALILLQQYIAQEEELHIRIKELMGPILNPKKPASQDIYNTFSKLLRADANAAIEVAEQIAEALQKKYPENPPSTMSVQPTQPPTSSFAKGKNPSAPTEVVLPMPGQYWIANKDFVFRGKSTIFCGDRIDVTTDRKVLVNGKEIGQV